MLLPALVAACLSAPLSLYAIVPSVVALAALPAFVLLFGAAIATIGVVAITINIPRFARLAIGANVLASGMFGAALAPTLIGFVSYRARWRYAPRHRHKGDAGGPLCALSSLHGDARCRA